jgi:ABC-type dipeptide/oligopeptide/nickel transport system ATPase component
MPEDTPLLRARDLTVSFPDGRGGRLRATDRAALDIHAGMTTALVGESGSGKSVTALSMLRLLPTPPARYDAGRIEFTTRAGDRLDLLAIDEPAIRSIRGNEISMIFQEPMTSLNPVLTIGDQVVEAIRLHRKARRSKAVEIATAALAEVGIPDPARRLRAYPHEFSGGMRQRVMIAIALACEPRLLIADEPTTALDVTIQAQILELIRALKASHSLGVLLITHDLALVANHADHIVVMYAGRVVESGPASAVLARPRHPYTRGLLDATPAIADDRPRLRTLDDSIADESRFRFEIDGSPRRAWWPDPAHPAFAGEAREHALAMIAPGHAVRIWNS